MAEISFVKVDIAGLVMEYALLGGGGATDAQLAEWLRGLVLSLAHRDPTTHAYAARLLGEAEAYRQAEAQRKARAKQTAIDSRRAESAESLESAEIPERHYNQPTNQPIREEKRAAAQLSVESLESAESAERQNPLVQEEKGMPLTKSNKRTKAPLEFFSHEWLQNETIAKAWAAWVKQRKANRKPPTVEAQALAMRKLQDLSGNDQSAAIPLITAAIESGWMTFYPPKSPPAWRQEPANAMGPLV